jgi:putative transposase
MTVRREGRHWYASIRCVDVQPMPLAKTGREVGLDLGVVHLVCPSDGRVLDARGFERRAAGRLAAAQRALSTKQRGSMHRKRAVERVALHHRRVRNQRHDFAHKLSRELVDAYDLIVLENLSITSMVRRSKPRPKPDGSFEPNGEAAKAGLNRSIHDAGWGELVRMLTYKAERAVVSYVLSNPATRRSGAPSVGTSTR